MSATAAALILALSLSKGSGALGEVSEEPFDGLRANGI